MSEVFHLLLIEWLQNWCTDKVGQFKHRIHVHIKKAHELCSFSLLTVSSDSKIAHLTTCIAEGKT